MNADRWREVNALFHEALDLPPQDRARLLDRTAERDPDLVKEVRSLLQRHQSSTGFLEQPVWAVAPDLILDPGVSLVGRQLGSYRVLSEIGRGGMGVVYAARDERLGRTVAIKALPPEYTTDQRRRDRLAREARAAAAFTHESIATVFALEEIDGALFIVSELVEGETLRSELGRGPTPVDRLLPTLIAIASGLAAAHAHNVVHRDLKPENIVRRTDGQIKILDFGLARFSDPQVTITKLTEPGTAPGTPGYMAPEQLTGAEADARSDLFAFGIVGWELATGEHPFGSNPALMLTRMMEGRPATLAQQLPIPALEPIIRRCLKVAPSDRYPSAESLLADLRQLASNPSRERIVPESSDEGLWWWRFHQRAAAVADASTPILVGLAGLGLTRRTGTWLFFTTLALATMAVTLRLNLLFTARVHRAMLPAHRAKLFRWIAGAEFTLCLLMFAIALAVIEAQSIVAGVMVCVAIVMAAALLLIEPTTTGAAGLDRPPAP